MQDRLSPAVVIHRQTMCAAFTLSRLKRMKIWTTTAAKPATFRGTMMASTKEERSRRVANMRANFAQEGGVPGPAQNALLDRYIEVTATLADLLEHAYEYATTAQERQEERRRKGGV